MYKYSTNNNKLLKGFHNIANCALSLASIKYMCLQSDLLVIYLIVYTQ